MEYIRVTKENIEKEHIYKYAECYINKYAENSFHYQIIP